MIPLKSEELATITSKKGLDYQLTQEDVLWAARMAVFEGGERADDLLWCMTQRYGYISKKTRESNFPAFHQLLTSYCQPINPKWRRDGKFCSVGGKYHGKGDCSEAKLNRRDEAHTLTWDGLKKKSSVRMEAVEKWARGQLPNSCIRAVDFADKKVSQGYLNKNPGAELLKEAGNWFLMSATSKKWDEDFITMVAPDGSTVSGSPAENNDAPGLDLPEKETVPGIAAVATPVGSTIAWSKEIETGLYEQTEKKIEGGYFPIGANSVWHGGVHLSLSEGAKIRAPFAGVIVAARLGQQNYHPYGSSNFILVKHQLTGKELADLPANSGCPAGKFSSSTYCFYSLFMHLDTIAVDPSSEQLKDIRWLSPDDPTTGLTAKVGKKGKNFKNDVALVQEKLKAIGLYADKVDSQCGPKTIAAIRDFQAGFMKKPDSTVDPGGNTWNRLVEEAKKKDGGFDGQLIDVLNSGSVVRVSIPVFTGETLWTIGKFGGIDNHKTIVHWEVFSSENLLPQRAFVEDLDDDFSLDCPSITSKVEQDSWFFDTDVIDNNEVKKFYTTNAEAAKLRTYVCRFHSEWAVNPDTAVPKLAGHFDIEGVADAIRPYLWWKHAADLGADLPADPKVYHYNPVAFTAAISAMTASAEQESDDNEYSDMQTDDWEQEEQSVWDGESSGGDEADEAEDDNSLPDYYCDNDFETGQSIDTSENWESDFKEEQSVWDGGATVPVDGETGSAKPKVKKPFEEISQAGNLSFYCWRSDRIRRTIQSSACGPVSIVMALHNLGFQEGVDKNKKVLSFVKFMRGNKKEQQYDGGDKNPPKVIPRYDYITAAADPSTPELIGALPAYTEGKFKGYYIRQSGTRAAQYTKAGVDVIEGTIEKITDLVKKGELLIISTTPGIIGGLNRIGDTIGTKAKPYKPKGHFVVITGLNSEGYFTIADPAQMPTSLKDLDRIKPELLKENNFIGITPV